MTIAHQLTYTCKVGNLYVAYAPEAELCHYGACFEEAVNGLTEELAARPEPRQQANSRPAGG